MIKAATYRKMGKFWCYKHFNYDILRLHVWSSLLCFTGGVLISFSETPKFHPDWVSVGSISGNIHVNLIWLPFHVFYSVDILFSNNQQKTATGTTWYCRDSPNSTLNLILTQLPEQKTMKRRGCFLEILTTEVFALYGSCASSLALTFSQK